MSIWVIIDRDRWGHSTNVVRADNREAAIACVFPSGIRNPDLVHIEELREGDGILWCEDDSPDSPRD